MKALLVGECNWVHPHSCMQKGMACAFRDPCSRFGSGVTRLLRRVTCKYALHWREVTLLASKLWCHWQLCNLSKICTIALKEEAFALPCNHSITCSLRRCICIHPVWELCFRRRFLSNIAALNMGSSQISRLHTCFTVRGSWMDVSRWTLGYYLTSTCFAAVC